MPGLELGLIEGRFAASITGTGASSAVDAGWLNMRTRSATVGDVDDNVGDVGDNVGDVDC